MIAMKLNDQKNLIPATSSRKNAIQKNTSIDDLSKLMTYKEILEFEISEVNIVEQIEELSILFEKSNLLGEEISKCLKSTISLSKIPDISPRIICEDQNNVKWRVIKRRIVEKVKKRRKNSKREIWWTMKWTENKNKSERMTKNRNEYETSDKFFFTENTSNNMDVNFWIILNGVISKKKIYWKTMMKLII